MDSKNTTAAQEIKVATPIRAFADLYFAREESRRGDLKKHIEELRVLGYRVSLVEPIINASDNDRTKR